MTKAKTPYEFEKIIDDLIMDYTDNPELFHIKSDEAMEDMLIELGYERGVRKIQFSERWYT